MVEINKLIEEIDSSDTINDEKSFELIKSCSKWLRKDTDDTNARRVIIHILNKWNDVSNNSKQIWVDLIEASGFYPYLYQKNLTPSSTLSKFRFQVHQSEYISNIYFHEEQKILIDLLNSDKNVIVSAPTSFGKSLLIQDVVASKKYNNIVVIQPTLALLDETRKKLKGYQKDYKIIVRTSQQPDAKKGNLFLLTAERVMEYKDLPKIDLLILDEFYKLSEKRPDERSDVLNNAFHLLLKRDNVKFYLLGPNIKDISEGFAEKYNAKFCKTNYSLVDNKVVDLYSCEYGQRGEAKIRKEKALFELLFQLKNEQTLIYCSSPARARYLAKNFKTYIQEKIPYDDNKDLSIIEWIEKNVDKDWCLIGCLKNHIGFHDGALQKHITSSIIKYFNSNRLNFLFCTSTIIEGVNTSAKNVVIFDNWKGNYKKTNFIDYFDYSNIKGRAGRLMIHYLGNVYNFNQIPDQKDLIVDIPFFEQKPIKDEVLIHLDDAEIEDKNSSQYKELNSIPKEERDMFRRNGALVKGQKKILDQLRVDFQTKKQLFIWSGLKVKYNQLKYVLDLGWDNLLKPTETTRPMSKKKLVKVTFDYGIEKSISFLIKSNFRYFKQEDRFPDFTDQDIFDEAIRDAFQILRHWFQYKVPKWLNVISELQKYVCKENGVEAGDYTFYSSQIENDFIRENLAILLEYGIPRTALEKLKEKIDPKWSEDEVVNFIRDKKEDYSKYLLNYESEKIQDSL